MYPGACSKDVCCIARPFIWRGEVWLGHWIGFLPAQERMALARLDMAAGVVKFEYRFSHLPEEVEAAQHPDTAQDIQTGAAPLPARVFCAHSMDALCTASSDMPALRWDHRSVPEVRFGAASFAKAGNGIIKAEGGWCLTLQGASMRCMTKQSNSTTTQ